MKRTYTGVLRDVYYAPRKIIIAQGRRLEFIDGVARGIPEFSAQTLFRQKVLTEITPEFEVVDGKVFEIGGAPISLEGRLVVEVPDVVEEVDAVEEEVEELVDEVEEALEEVVEAENSGEEKEEPSIEMDPVEGNPETSDGLLSRSDVEELYERLGTWTAVAEELDISTTTLKKYRDELGL